MTTREQTALQKQLETIIFGTTTPAGRAFDLSLLALILASVAVVMLDSVEPYHDRHGLLFARLELGFTQRRRWVVPPVSPPRPRNC